ALVGVLAKGAEAAVRVADRGVKEDPADAGEDGVAEPRVRPGHCARLDSAQEAIADYELVALAQLGDQRTDGREVVARISVAHDDEAALRGIDAADQGAAVPLALDVHHPRAQLARDQLRTVAAAVVGDDDLGGVPALLDRPPRPGDASGQGLHLVEAWHHDRDLDGRPRVIAPPGGTLRDLHCARG